MATAKKTSKRKRTPMQRKIASLEASLGEARLQLNEERERSRNFSSLLTVAARERDEAARARDDHFRNLEPFKNRATKAETDLSTANRSIETLKQKNETLEKNNLVLDTRNKMLRAAVATMAG